MVRRKRALTNLDHLIDDLLGENPTPEQILGEDGLVKTLTQRIIERALAGELTAHLKAGDPVTDAAESPSPRNSRNGYSKKTVQTDQGNMGLEIPRDRQGDFEPILVPKHQRRLAGLDEKIIALYARGLSTRDISAQLQELYGVELSPSVIRRHRFRPRRGEILAVSSPRGGIPDCLSRCLVLEYQSQWSSE